MPSPIHGHFVWLELLTRDVVAPRAFYPAVFGWGVIDAPMEPDPYPMFTVGEVPVAGMMLMRSEVAPSDAPQAWLGYVGVDDIEKAHATAVARGATSYRAPADIPGVGRFAVIGDPWGATIAMLEPVEVQPPPFPAPAGYLNWGDVAVTDIDAALDFYGAVFGWTAGATHDMGEMGPYQLIQAQGQDIAGIYRHGPSMPPSSWTYYITVADVHAAVARVKANGGQCLLEPHEVPGGSVITICMDPVHSVFAMTQPAS